MRRIQPRVVLESLLVGLDRLIKLAGALLHDRQLIAVFVRAQRHSRDGIPAPALGRQVAVQNLAEVEHCLVVLVDVGRGQPVPPVDEGGHAIGVAVRVHLQHHALEALVSIVEIALPQLLEAVVIPLIEIVVVGDEVDEHRPWGQNEAHDAEVDQRVEQEGVPVHPSRFLDPGPPFGGHAGFVHFVPELRPPRVGERPQREVRLLRVVGFFVRDAAGALIVQAADYRFDRLAEFLLADGVPVQAEPHVDRPAHGPLKNRL